MPYVFSTLTGDQEYTLWAKKDPKEVPTPTKAILIAGGANVMGKHLRTAQGVATSVTKEELELLEDNDAFKRHKDRGFITVGQKAEDADKVAQSSMAPKDKSAPLTEKDFEKGKAPVTNKKNAAKK